MAEFTRKVRFTNYNDNRCKGVLRKDFLRRCAYCRCREGDLGGSARFEKDHFHPKSKGGSDAYNNLFYACKECNGKSGKSDYWSDTLLNPCEHDIWGVHIKLNQKYVCEPLTSSGKEYITALKLNRKSYVKRRRTIADINKELNNELIETESICQELINERKDERIIKHLNRQILELRKKIELGDAYKSCEADNDDECLRETLRALDKIGKVIERDGNYDLDYELINGDTKYYCNIEYDKLSFNADGMAKKYISNEKIDAWKIINEKEKVMLVIYDTNDHSIYGILLDDVLGQIEQTNKTRYAYSIEKKQYCIFDANNSECSWR